ncbi:hypothetical protein, partial [Hydrogenimonas sp.]
EVPVVPVKITGTDRSLPRDEALWVPFILDIGISAPLRFHGSVKSFLEEVETLYRAPLKTPKENP